MSGMIFELVEVLNEQAKYFNDLLLLSNEKRDVIINNDTETLKKITLLENSLINKNNKLEIKSLELIKDIASVLNKDYETLTIGSLAEMVMGQDIYEKLTEASSIMKEKLELLKQSNGHNRNLITNSLEYIDFTINIVRSSFVNEPTYIYNGKGEHVDNGKVFFDAKQ